jgi:hypothetical protein
MLIKREPVGKLVIKRDGKCEIVSFKGKKEEECIYCKEKTRERELGLAVCEKCKEYDYSKCKECKYGVNKSAFVSNGNDLEDYVKKWIGCAIRNHFLEKQDPNPNSCGSAWHISPTERRKCFHHR